MVIAPRPPSLAAGVQGRSQLGGPELDTFAIPQAVLSKQESDWILHTFQCEGADAASNEDFDALSRSDVSSEHAYKQRLRMRR